MKRKILSIFAMVAIAFGMTSCHDEFKTGPESGATGEIRLKSMAVEVNNAERVIESRASIDLSGFIVRIFNSQGAQVKEWTYATMPELFVLDEGDYTVRVYSHEVQKAEWESPYFVGEKDFSITAGEISDLGIVTCYLKNIKVSIKFEDKVRQLVGDDCKVTVVCNDEGRMEFTPDEKRSAYFEALEGSSTLVATFTGTVGGHYETFSKVITGVEAGQHHIITPKIKEPVIPDVDEYGNINPDGGITIDFDVEDEDLNGSVNVTEDNLGADDRPGKEEGEEPGPGPDDPIVDPTDETLTITSDYVDFDKLNPVDLETVVVAIDSQYGLEHLQVTITTDNANFEAAVSDLLPLSFDLAYPPAANAEQLAGLGFPTGDQVIGATHVDFDISAFVPLLSAFPGVHNFQISATDSKSKQVIKTLSFKAE